ncbi:retropepsin-like aspartic protease family protein [Aurantiacibacter poecillastricola]|uniref:retropepsin-like aspartic protease family protein n=1 Tax=Aurantiacibacter poecillastricola TaxID=3064385 RepID=UPI00273D9DA0|nr:TIGR02281 family clan AA aspartic protease [Aurantiacibacter sp. 219JJ12-13]MDP5261549.1 TIGR02281 family clan AA aspartic protease [Aurantiacibacter sp. 219JJ12-13]
MDFSAIFDQLALTIREIPQSGLLMAALAAMAAGVLGSFLLSRLPVLGKMLRLASTFALMAVLVLVVLQLSRLDPRFSMAVPELGYPEQVVEGGETRIPLSRDGHYWLEADVNGTRAAFLVDTGATLTAVSERTAEEAGLTPREGGLPIRLQTANGAVAAQTTSIESLRFGNVAAYGLDAVIAPGLGETNVIGMNLLSRLASVRIEDGLLILVPNNPQEPLVTAD